MTRYFTISFLFIFLFLGFNLPGQDTTVIQTFTWDSTARSAYFNFPDDPAKSYEKILMIYNMRCHDAAVGNGSVGCREWDYSCNTFLYVPEIQDSSLAFHYDYDVSQNSEDYFAYTDETHYTYYTFDKVHTSYKKTNAEYAFKIGEDNGVAHIEANKAGKVYMIYTQEELQNATLTEGDIHGLALNLTGMSEMQNARIRMASTPMDHLSIQNSLSEELTEVFYEDLSLSEGFNRFNFHSPFFWDGASNLLIELSYDKIIGTSPALIVTNSELVHALISSYSSNACLEFGGSWGVELEKESFAPIEDEITIAFWAFGRPQSLPKNTTALEALDPNGKRTLNIHLPWSNSSIYWDCGNEGGNYDRINKSASEVEFEGKWHHWAFTKNSTTGSMKIYLDGQLWHSGEGKHRPIDVESFRLGSSVSHNLGYYGMLDEFVVLSTELDSTGLWKLMNDDLIINESWYDKILAYYDMEEAAGNVLMDRGPQEKHAYFEGGPQWRKVRGRHLHNGFLSIPAKAMITFYRGDYDIEQDIIQELDTLITPQNSVIQYSVENSQLVALDTFYTWEAVDSKVYDEWGEEVESYYVEPLDFLFFEELKYYQFREGKFELLSLVTPYGNGLNLGPEGKTFTFDVTDFTPILKGNKRLSIEMGGQNQEELDIKFLFIEGTPSRDVLDIRNIWPFSRGYYQSIQEDRVFEPRMLRIPSDVHQAKIRASITGHGQNGEFVARNHRIHLNNNKIYDFEVWKECAYNPIYPQGGTWIYDRAGWCPGMATDLHEFEIIPEVSPGDEVEIEYEVNGPYMDQANYLVSNQLVYYGEANFYRDAALESIVRPNQEAVEFARFNPNCTDPAIIIKNNGSTTLKSLLITYGVEGVSEKSFTWTGQLDFLEKTQVDLPIESLSFYGVDSINTFFVRIDQPNGGSDEYTPNNALTSTYRLTDVYEGSERWLLRVRTNSRAIENAYSLVDQQGNVILSRQNLSNNTTYDDEISLPAGCYHFEITDTGNDGLSFWNNPGAGSGWVSIRRMVNDNISFEKIKFESDFGAEFQYDFIIDESVGSQDLDRFQRVGIYPNPAFDRVSLEVEGLNTDEIHYQILNDHGQILSSDVLRLFGAERTKNIAIDKLQPGHYLLKVMSDQGSWVKAFVKI